ncbi:MAG: hypothetical protein V7K57_26970 [Nostoc sp.]|uniref:hypothetical protein n=1 Tax=Nostoc sp. TaxID=1180 RepID=UPI002FF4C8AC
MIEISLWMGNDRVIFWLYLGIALIFDTDSEREQWIAESVIARHRHHLMPN